MITCAVVKVKSQRTKTKTNTYQFKLTIAMIRTKLITSNVLTPRRNEVTYDTDNLHQFPLIKKVRLPLSIYI